MPLTMDGATAPTIFADQIVELFTKAGAAWPSSCTAVESVADLDGFPPGMLEV
eukprot:NODE_28922_length_462_cov_1.779104.p3 GENE.NODE_28922_length_462_cov_1.779104~~NODE_28922_length_462_cov_1.779104.p3  ORF type:complete len:53 (+),score=10.22 NODE_28922_length_462_cov_1.779104:182-340(+)